MRAFKRGPFSVAQIRISWHNNSARSPTVSAPSVALVHSLAKLRRELWMRAARRKLGHTLEKRHPQGEGFSIGLELENSSSGGASDSGLSSEAIRMSASGCGGAAQFVQEGAVLKPARATKKEEER